MSTVNPPESQFSAIVGGKPTGLAGCLHPCGRPCLRADVGLPFRWDFNPYPACCAFIPAR